MNINDEASLSPTLTSPGSLHETEHTDKVKENCELYLRTIITIQTALHEEKLRHEHEQAKIWAQLASLFNLIQPFRSDIDSENTQNETPRTSSLLPKPDTTGSQDEVIEIDDGATTSSRSTTVESENQSFTRSLQDPTSREQSELSDGSVLSLSPERSTSPNHHEQHDQEESTVEVLKVEKTAPARSGLLPYSPDEEEYIGRAAQRLLAEGFTRTETFRQIAELGKARGHKRTPAALTIRWYTKILKKHPIQTTQQATELGDEGRPSATTREKPMQSKTSIKVPVSSRMIPANDKHSVCPPFKSAPAPEIKGNSPIRSIHATLALNRQSCLLDVRLGDGVPARRFGRLGISELQKATGKHFNIERI